MRRGLFGRVILVYALVLAAALVFTEYYVTGVVRRNHVEDLTSNLSVQAALIARGIEPERWTSSDTCGDLGRLTGSRITLIGPEGHVLCDSQADPADMENHGNRPEVVAASRGGVGTAIRYSGTLNGDRLYAALRAPPLGGYVRLSVPLGDVDAAVRDLRTKILLAVTLVILASSIVPIVQASRIGRLVGHVGAFSDTLAKGKLDERLVLEGAGEFEDIAANLNKMAGELQTLITRRDEENERLNAILMNIPEALLILDPQDTIVMWSAASRKFFGTARLSGRSVAEVVRSPGFFELMDRVKAGLVSGEAEIGLSFPEERHLSVKCSRFSYAAGEAPSSIVIFRDVTQARKLEQVRKDFVANVSHELKTPVSAIKGFADTLLDGALEDREDAERFVSIIKSNSERINSLVEDLMTISRLELGVIQIRKAPVDLREVMEHVAETLKDKAERKGLSLTVDVSADADRIDADRNRLIQVLTNLVDNAVKFTNSGGVTLGAERGNGQARVFVRDTGIGMPRKHLPRIGERFYRVDPSRSREMGGTGLGLAIVKHLVKAHGWDMRIESREGEGTTVIVSVP